MNFKNHLIVLGLFLLSSGVEAQIQKRGLFVGTGITQSFIQDLEYSAYTHTNRGINFRLGYQNIKEKTMWHTGLEIKGLIGAAFEEGWLQYTIHPTVHFAYLRKIKPLSAGDIWLGSRMDVFDLNVFINSNLSNNGGYYFASNNLYLTGEWHKSLNNKWDFDAGMSVTVLGFVKESTSFSFSIPQKVVDEGKFSYQDDTAENPFKLKYYSLKTLGNYNRIRTEIGFTKNNRNRFSYQWELANYAQSEGNPLTFGSHNFKWTIYFGKRKSADSNLLK